MLISVEFKKALNRTEREVLLDEEIAEQKPLKYQKKWRKILRVGRFVFRFSIDQTDSRSNSALSIL